MNIKKLDVNLLNKDDKSKKAIVYLNKNDYVLPSLKVIKKYPFISAVGVVATTNDIKKLSYNACVEYICSVSKIHNFISETFSISSNTLPNYNKNYNKNDLSNNYTKILYKLLDLKYPNTSNFSVCILDTGVSPHIDICLVNNRLTMQKDFTSDSTFPYDDNGHGTFVCGVIASNGLACGKKVLGVSPRVNIISVKIMNKDGESDVFSALDGMQWIADNYKKYNIKAVCMSFGATPLDVNDPLVCGVESLVKLGISVVCASGNSGEDTFMSPAISSEVISVGSVNKNKQISSFTSYGVYKNTMYPYVYSVGEDVISLSNESLYVSMSGTSVACPKVCGFICNLISRYPNFSPLELKRELLNYCEKVNDIYILDTDKFIIN